MPHRDRAKHAPDRDVLLRPNARVSVKRNIAEGAHAWIAETDAKCASIRGTNSESAETNNAIKMASKG